MKNNKYKILIIITLSFLLYSCQGAKDALQGKKRSKGADEFLVEKKNPLSMPPEYGELPIPGSTEKKIVNKDINNSDIKELLNIEQSSQPEKNSNSTDIESSILDKIK